MVGSSLLYFGKKHARTFRSCDVSVLTRAPKKIALHHVHAICDMILSKSFKNTGDVAKVAGCSFIQHRSGI
jgi:hypothetical protein